MTALLNALRSRFDRPRDAMRALGLDERLLDDPRSARLALDGPYPLRIPRGAPRIGDIFAKDASLADVMEFIDAVKGGGKTDMPTVAQADEYEDDDEDD